MEEADGIRKFNFILPDLTALKDNKNNLLEENKMLPIQNAKNGI